MDQPAFEVGQLFIGVVTTKHQESCSQCGDLILEGTPVLASIGTYTEKYCCPRCFNWLRSNLIHEANVQRPEPVIDLADLELDEGDPLPPHAVSKCPKCDGNEFSVTWLSYYDDNFASDEEYGQPQWLGNEWPSQDPGDIVSLQCRGCNHTLYERLYA